MHAALIHQVRSAAEAEILKNTLSIDSGDIYRESSNAFDALSTLLGTDHWFLGTNQPTLLDASVFAYTHLLLDEEMHWSDGQLASQVIARQNLVDHRNRVLDKYFPEAKVDTLKQSNS